MSNGTNPLVEAIKEICAGNESAGVFCLNLLGWVHVFDDLIDGDKPPLVLSDLAEANFVILATFGNNAFYQEHKNQITPLLLMAALSHLESERFVKKESVLDRVASQVLKSQYQDIFYYVAYALGGWAHMRKMSEKYRGYNFDPAPAPCPTPSA